MNPRIRSEMQAVRGGLRCSTIEAIFATIHMILTQGVFLTNYVLDLGASNFLCGVIQSLPFLTQFSYFISPMLVRRLRQRKPVAVYFSIMHRIAWLVLIGLLFVDWSPGVKQGLMVLTLFLSNICAVIAGNAWFSWMTDLVPPTIRGAYYGRRNAYLGLTSMVALWIGTQVLTQYRQIGLGHIGYTLCFSVGVASALFAAWMLTRQYEPPSLQVPAISIGRLFRKVRHSQDLRSFIWFASLWQFWLGIAAAFVGVYMVKILKMSPAQMGYQALIASVFSFIGSRLWGKVRDREGDRVVLIATGMTISIQILLWMPSRADFLWPLWIISCAIGFSWSGFNLVMFSWPQKFCGKEDRQYTFGLLGLFSGPAFVLGSLSGGILTTVLPQVLFHIGSFEVVHFHLVFVLSSLGRAIAVYLIAYKTKNKDRHTQMIIQSLIDSFRAMVR